jgi:hypothetical protein
MACLSCRAVIWDRAGVAACSVLLAFGQEGNRAGRIIARVGCGAVLPGGDQPDERSDRLFALLAAHRRDDGTLHAHRRRLPGARSWWWHGGQRPGPPEVADISENPGLGRCFDGGSDAGLPPRRRWRRHTRRTAARCPLDHPARGKNLAGPGKRARRSSCAPHGPGTTGRQGPAPHQRPPATLHTHARRAASIVDIPPGHISLGAHRKARTGHCQHVRQGRGYRSQQEPATVPGVRARIGIRADRAQPWLPDESGRSGWGRRFAVCDRANKRCCMQSASSSRAAHAAVAAESQVHARDIAGISEAHGRTPPALPRLLLASLTMSALADRVKAVYASIRPPREHARQRPVVGDPHPVPVRPVPGQSAHALLVADRLVLTCALGCRPGFWARWFSSLTPGTGCWQPAWRLASQLPQPSTPTGDASSDGAKCAASRYLSSGPSRCRTAPCPWLLLLEAE